MTPADLTRACQQLSGGNVAEFCRAIGISRDSYYRALKDGPSELTTLKVKDYMQRRGET